MAVSADVTEFIAKLPKTELHLHLVGSASPDTVLELAKRHPSEGVPTDPAELREFYEFVDFPHFIDTYAKVDNLVRTAQDVHDLLLGLARDAASSNVRYAEVTVTAAMHIMKGVAPQALAEVLEQARYEAVERHFVELNYIYDIPAGFGRRAVDLSVEFAVQHRPQGTVALGLAGLEVGYPRADYAEAFAAARDSGLHVVAHAGETTGADEVWSAIRTLGAERIGHGVGAAEDPELLAYLKEHDIALEVCPVSNRCTMATPDLARHPLPRFLDAGVPVALSTDDPGMFHTDLNNEYFVAAELAGLDRPALAEIARTGVRASFADEDAKSDLLGAIDEVLES